MTNRNKLFRFSRAIVLTLSLLLVAFVVARTVDLSHIFSSWWWSVIACGAYPLLVLGTMLYCDLRAIQSGMAWKSSRPWKVVILDGALVVTAENGPQRTFQIAEIRGAKHVFDNNWTPPLNLQDALIIETPTARFKLPASAEGFADVIVLLDSLGKLQRIEVEAFGWD